MSCKLLHNAAVFASDVVLAEAMTTAAKASIDTDAFHEVLKKCAMVRPLHLQLRARVT
jgi:3-hydroxyisobutyrate dehydrogenase-like beta-hydroxyacid dehydrogenase